MIFETGIKCKKKSHLLQNFLMSVATKYLTVYERKETENFIVNLIVCFLHTCTCTKIAKGIYLLGKQIYLIKLQNNNILLLFRIDILPKIMSYLIILHFLIQTYNVRYRKRFTSPVNALAEL